MKTMLELAQELDVPKLKIYRHIKKHSIETHQENGVIYLDATAEQQIKSALQHSEPHHTNTSDTHHETLHDTASETAVIQLLQSTVELLTRQLEAKDRQIAELAELNRNQQVLLKQEQDRQRVGFWRRLFLSAGKTDQV